MTNNELMPMDLEDLKNWEMLFSMTIRGIDDHIECDQVEAEFLISTLLSLDRHLQIIVKDLFDEWKSRPRTPARGATAAE